MRPSEIKNASVQQNEKLIEYRRTQKTTLKNRLRAEQRVLKRN